MWIAIIVLSNISFPLPTPRPPPPPHPHDPTPPPPFFFKNEMCTVVFRKMVQEQMICFTEIYC